MAACADPAGAAVLRLGARPSAAARQLVNEPGAWAMSHARHAGSRAARPRSTAPLFGWTTEAFGRPVTLFRLPGYVGGEPEQPVSARWWR